MNIFVVTVDLRQRDASVEVAPSGDDPDGQGKWQTTLDETPDVAERAGFEVAVNGDFFGVEQVIDPQTGKKRGYHEGQRATVVGPAMTDGKLWSAGPADKARPCLVVTRQRRALIDDDGRQLPRGAVQAIAGSNVLLKDGRRVVETESKFSTTRHPRTAVGVADDGRTLILVVVDGRRPEKSVGMSLAKLADLMLQLGCDDALNLDGGGSSTLVMRDPQTSRLVILNNPSDGKPRPVANVLGVDLDGAGRATTRPTSR
jgi:exopolysaccharide biosynthesis protein